MTVRDSAAAEPGAEGAASVARAQREWLRRTEAEYRSATITHHLTFWLMKIAAPFELVRDGFRIADDELVHSEMSFETHRAAGGAATPVLDRDTLGITERELQPLELSVARTCVRVFCLGETVAVRLFAGLRDGCDQPQARAALDRILRDEVRHRDFGWTLLEWLLTTPQEAAIRALVERELPELFAQLKRSYAHASLGDETPRSDLERHWGMMPVGLYARAVEETFHRDYEPRFREVGIEAERAWRAPFSPS